MKNVVEILKNYYKPVENAQRSREFFFSLADYVRYIKTTPELKKIIQEIIKEKEKLLKEWEKYEVKALKELENAKQKLLKIVKQNKISNPELDEAIRKLNWYETGKMLSSGIKSDNIEHHLWDIAKVLFQTKYKEFLKEFIDEKPNTPNIYVDNKNFVFSRTIRKRRTTEESLAELRNTELWGCWDHLNLVPVLLLDKKKFHEVVSESDLGIVDIFIELSEIFRMRKCIQNEIGGILPPQIPPEEAREMQKYKLYASRINNYLIQELNLNLGRKELPKSPLQKEIDRRVEKAQFKKEIIEELKSKKKTQDSKKPFCIVENNYGYLKFDKYGEKIKIGTPKSRHFRLLECLLEPFGRAKTIEGVFDWIRLLKDKKDSDLSGWDNYKKHNRQITIIQNTIKELQKGNKLRGKLAFEFDDTKTKIWIKLLE